MAPTDAANGNGDADCGVAQVILPDGRTVELPVLKVGAPSRRGRRIAARAPAPRAPRWPVPCPRAAAAATPSMKRST